MIMDAEDVQSDLHALKRLYGLVKNKGGEASNTGSDSLDARARLLLKNLLDTATTRVLESHSQVVAGQAEASVALSPARPDEAASEEGAFGQRRCRICRRNTVKQLARNSSASDRHLWNRNRVKEIRWLPSNKADERASDADISSDRMAIDCSKMSSSESISKPEEPDCLAQEASRSIQRIEGCMSALHMLEKASSTPQQSRVSGIGTSLGDNFLIRNNLLFEISEEERNQPYLSEEDNCRFPTKKLNKIYVQNVNAIVEEIEPGKWIMSSSRCVPSSVALIPSYTVEDEHSKPSLMNPKNHPPNIKQEKLVNSQPKAQHKAAFQKGRHYKTAEQLQESDGTATDSYSNSSSDQTSSRDSNSEDDSVADQSRGLHYVSSSKSSGSWDLPLSQGSGSSSYDEEVYSSSSQEGGREVTTSSSSEEDGYSSHEQPLRSYAKPKNASKQSTSKKSGPSRMEKAYKQSGVFKRLKDRLAVIFHHHHHHHHHHDHHNRGDRTKNEENMSRNSSLNKHKGKDISPKRQKAVEKIQKSQIHEKQGQHNHFHGLVGGLMRHVRHSKQSKKGKRTADQLAHEHGRKRTLKKNWWQLVQHHGRSKLHDKTHMKLGLGKKKTHLRALPKIE